MKRLFDNHTTSLRADIFDGILIGTGITVLSYIVGLHFNWESSLNLLEVFAVWTSYVCTYWCVKERRINYPIGAISTAAYAILFFKAHLYSSAVLNIYLTPTLVYGWIRWRKDSITRPVKHVSAKWIPAYLLVTVAGYFGASYISQALGGSMAWMDALILSGTILAQFLMDNKKLENWIIWLIVDIIATYEYFASHLYLVAFQYVFFALNAVYGFYVWYRSMHDDRVRTNDSNAPNIGALAVN